MKIEKKNLMMPVKGRSVYLLFLLNKFNFVVNFFIKNY